MNQFEFFEKFPTEDNAIDFIVETKYKDGYVCPKCGCVHHRIYHQKYNHRYLYCNNCKSEFSALTGTIFEHTHLDLRMWLFAINLVLIARKGISGLQLQRELGMVSYKGAFRMLKLIRYAMGTEAHKDTFEAIVEIDETYVGGKPRKRNGEKKKSKRGRGTSKTPVVGVVERSSGRIYAKVALPNKEGKKLSGKQLLSILDEVCKSNTTVMTDQLSSYGILDGKSDRKYIHIKIDHSMTYSLGDGKHTNTIESCWAILKRGVYGIYHHISARHLQEYVDEFCYRLNHRDVGRAFKHLLGLGIGCVCARA
ncbi:MAG: IS1595 family transposase [Bacteroidales bacterium]|nr:IS1595 family transposase [Bacteroidales bacterium]